MKRSLSKREINRQRWRERVNAWKESNQSQKAFCEERHLGFASFKRWHGIFRAESLQSTETAAEASGFVPVRVRETPSSNLTILIQEDLRIDVASGFNPHLLRQIIEVLRTS